MKTLAFVVLIWMCETVTQAFPEKRNENTEDEGTQLRFCRIARGIDECASRYGLKLPIDEVFRLMTVDPLWLTAACHDDSMEVCLSGCERQFKASKYGYTYSICTQRNVIRRQRQCWDEGFPGQASRCFHRYYPQERQEAFYPTPFQVYDKASIARDCFPNEPEPCRQQKTHVLYYLMPQYYEIFPQPPTQ